MQSVMTHRLLAPLAAMAGAILMTLSAPAALAAEPVRDCPLRDAPFSADSPLIDVLLSPAARAVLERANPGRLDRLPPQFAGTQPPTFAAILTVRTASRFTGIQDDSIAAIDRDLRALPVTDADRAARCARYDNERPALAQPAGAPRILLFEKINGFRDAPSVNAARAAFLAMAERNGWSITITEQGGAINPRTLRRYDLIIWNNISGDVLTLSQRRALVRYMERGGGFLAVHGSAGDPAYFWDWYVDTLIGARFAGHPMAPQFQDARIVVADRSHPIAAALPAEWTMNDEWYSFRTNPRAAGAHVILTLDEATYTRTGPMGQDLTMGADHPLAWTNCVGKGRMFYSAIGHRPETYEQPQHVAMLEAAIRWTATARDACPARR